MCQRETGHSLSYISASATYCLTSNLIGIQLRIIERVFVGKVYVAIDVLILSRTFTDVYIFGLV